MWLPARGHDFLTFIPLNYNSVRIRDYSVLMAAVLSPSGTWRWPFWMSWNEVTLSLNTRDDKSKKLCVRCSLHKFSGTNHLTCENALAELHRWRASPPSECVCELTCTPCYPLLALVKVTPIACVVTRVFWANTCYHYRARFELTSLLMQHFFFFSFPPNFDLSLHD